MDYNLLKVLNAVVATGNVTRAAERLNLSQPATSNALARLRTAMDDPILIRSGNTMVPTARALQTAEQAELIASNIEQVFSPPPVFNPKTSSHRFTIALTDHGMQTVVPKLLQELANLAPNIKLDIRTLGEQDSLASISKALVNNDIDFLISRKTDTPKVFNNLDLFTDQFVTISSDTHPRINERLTKKMYLKEQHILVSFSGDRHGLVDAALGRENKSRNVAHTVNNFFSAALLIDKTDLLCTVSEKIAGNLTQKFNLQTFPCPVKIPEFKVAMYWSRAQEKKPEHHWFISFMANIKQQY
ncbi:LysR family transcriptional regulator [Paraglaciecola arctica]|uniref:HTH lysR-type domain-containing protein n=1 Tax=Paraglaciecola arctica BSs20135 TaxID=493475 RepID=K6XZM2_9ALTE|nr:LysR family transcriptional regulator [Paraglaciecola arctica]GAC17116.1 hypothetical protein GARC_0134 [Paraglaciecola arctica BSs20135]|tara:strand:+ start:1929 stop:2831 length:903 start_codon:yes stop_codon:yes gene_type:complete